MMLWQHLGARLERWLSGEPTPLDETTKICISVLQQHVESSGLDSEAMQDVDDVCRYAANMIAVALGVTRNVNIALMHEQVALAISEVDVAEYFVVANALLISNVPRSIVGASLLPKVERWTWQLLGYPGCTHACTYIRMFKCEAQCEA